MDVVHIVRDFQAGGFHDVREITVPHQSIPLHYQLSDRVFIILEGAMEIICNGGVCRAEPGMYVYIPAGCFHAHATDQSGCRYVLASRSW